MALLRVQRTRRRERALENLKSSYEVLLNKKNLEDSPDFEETDEANDPSAEGWETVSESSGTDDSGFDRPKRAVKKKKDPPKERPYSIPERELLSRRLFLRESVTDSSKDLNNRARRSRDHQRWCSECVALAHTTIQISLSFRIKEREKRRIISLKRFSVKDKEVIPFGDSPTHPHRFSLEAHNARANLFRLISGFAYDINLFRCSPEILMTMIGVCKQLKAICKQAIGQFEIDKLLKRLGYLLRNSRGRLGGTPDLSSPY